MEDRAAHHAVDLLVDRRGPQVPLDEPRGRARRHALELRDRVRVATADEAQRSLVGQPRPAVERRRRPFEPPAPAVLAREGRRLGAAATAERGERAQALALRGRRLELARESGERPADGGMADVVRVEELPHALPEGAWLARRALVAHRLADEHEPAARPGADGREEEAVAARGVGPHEARAAELVERAPRLVVEERLGPGAAREHPLLEPEHEDRVEAAVARAQQVEHGDPSRSAGPLATDGRSLERREQVGAAERDARRADRLELVERPADGVVRLQVEPRPVVQRGARRPVRVAEHRVRERADRVERARLAQARSSSGSGRLSRSSTVTATVRSPLMTPRPRRRPSTQSTSRRGRPE